MKHFKLPFKYQWPILIVLRSVKKYVDKRARVTINKETKENTIHYSIRVDRNKFVKKELNQSEIIRIFKDLHGEGYYA